MSEIQCCNWASHRYRFEIGDVVYMYICNIDGETRRIRYKTIVEQVHLTNRVDKDYWHIPLSNNESCLLRLIEEYEGTALDENEIKHVVLKTLTPALQNWLRENCCFILKNFLCLKYDARIKG